MTYEFYLLQAYSKGDLTKDEFLAAKIASKRKRIWKPVGVKYKSVKLGVLWP